MGETPTRQPAGGRRYLRDSPDWELETGSSRSDTPRASHPVRKWYQLQSSFPHLETGEYCSSGEVKMGSRKDKVLLNILLGTGVYLLDSWRNRMGGTVEDLRSRAQDTYETAADRVSRAE